MPSESTEKLQHIYRLQQGKLVSINHMTENLGGIRDRLEAFSAEQGRLAAGLEGCTNRCRAAIRRLEQKEDKGERREKTGSADPDMLSPARKKSLLQVMREVHDASSLAAESIHRLSVSHKHSAELLELSVIMVKHFLWRERLFMTVILGDRDSSTLKQVSVRSCALGKWYDGRGKRAYSHLPAYRSLGDAHFRYHMAINELADKDIKGMSFGELSAALARLEMLSQQIVGLIGQIQHHVVLLQSLPDD
ncbi:chemotaxis protein [Salmonella enterica subsp. enterica serovar Ramatgan]|nr:chemotaxis protein [Salmonella enterica subsp. enterica serovar Ramatgan]MDJ6542997.1 CZB domain-containing protein [Salmonella enterica]MDJ7049469.1 CZB domain-containing protein [Salmonella enterica]MDJ7338737.1 CZB domain-containing protein [Salmonella enterica]